jgi:hypothetical protein
MGVGMKRVPPRVAGLLAAIVVGSLHAAPPTPERVLELCAQVEGPSHCGRLVEAEQLKALPNLAVRDGDTLRVSLFPSGSRDFVDTIMTQNERTYALWDYWSPVNAVVLFITAGDELRYAVLQRATSALSVVPAEPVLAPDRQRVAVADFCSKRCENEITVWRITRDGLRKEATFKPAVPWSDVTVAWKGAEALTIQYTPPGEEKPRTLERGLADAEWKRS